MAFPYPDSHIYIVDEMHNMRTWTKPMTKITKKTKPLVEANVLSAIMKSSDNLRSLGWAIDISPGINADGRKGFVLTALTPTQPVEQPKENANVPAKKPARKPRT